MKKLLALGLLAASALPALAELKAGDSAPGFSTQASFAGKEFTYSLAESLKNGPVVMYFYPAAFTQGCTIEARMFAEAVPDYKALGATVVGVSNDKIETLNKFSVSECSSKFAVAADTDKKIMKAYDAVMLKVSNYASRTSYVISPAGRVIYVYSDSDPAMHVSNTMAALRSWSAANKPK
jgi:peroxiredoxin Q/BCP